MKDVTERAIDTIRTLAMDAVQKANSGHPGTAMALAPVAYELYRNTMRLDPKDPHWPDRDRFVLSAGHACMLQYAALHLSGYDLTVADIEQFRQWGSRTPGHPELHHTSGVETTTGPLGQGIGNAIGMALAERILAERFNRPGHEIVDHRAFAICSDGDLMEGVSAEASSLAGFLGLGKLTAIYDDNHITIEGSTSLAFGEDVGKRYEAYGWHVQRFDDSWTLATLQEALAAAEAVTDRPSLIILRTHIAIGAPHAVDTAAAHGAPLGEEEVRLAKKAYGWPEDAHFLVPDDVLAHTDRTAAGAELSQAWRERFEAYRAAHPDLAADYERVLGGALPEGWEAALPVFTPADGAIATRASGGTVMNALAAAIPELVGGSADLAPSTSTLLKGLDPIGPHAFGGRNMHWGIREHGMGAILNGMAVHGGLRVFGATFLIFSDYMRPSVRLASIMGLPVTYVWTHDSIWVGEDGPTHEPIEQIMSLRLIPHLDLMRPADANETAEAWRYAMLRQDGPVALALSRQGLPTLDRTVYGAAAGVRRGAYVLADVDDPQAIVIATGSEVSDALAARDTLAAEGVRVRVVSMPCWTLFARQDAAYRNEVLPPAVTARVSIEAGTPHGWERWVGDAGHAIGIDRFGASAPGKTVARELGITAEAVVEAVRALVAGGEHGDV